MILSNIKQFFVRNKNIIFFIGFFLIIFGGSSDVAFAAETETEEFIKKISAMAEFFLKGISVMLALITYLSTVFLSPEWINGSLFGLNTHFKAVWILVSNIVYFAFAFILIWIAFMNIIGKTGDQYQLKQALPKFIVGVLIVPFSWFLIQFILSISAILTVSALSLPFDTFKEFDDRMADVKIPKECVLDLTSINDKPFITCPSEKTENLTTVIESGDAIKSIYGIISMYTYGVLSFDTIGSVDKESFPKVTTMTDLAVKIVFDFLFVVIYSILMIALGLVLMIRGIYIWIYTMISPVFGLMYFFDKKEGGDGFFGKFNVKEFIALAMVPVYTMLALSFGLLFMYVVGSGLTGSSVGSGSVKIVEGKGKEDAKIKILDDFTLTIKGAAAKQKNVTGLLTKIGGGALGIVGSLILKIFGIVILWGTVMAAMRSSEITKTITQPLHDFGGKVGSIVASAPGNIPIFGGQSMKSMGSVAGSVQSHISQKELTRAGEFSKKHMSFMDSGTVDRNIKAQQIGKKIQHKLPNGLSNDLKKEYSNLLALYKDKPDSMRTDSGFKEAITAIAKKADIKTDDFKFDNLDNIAKTVVGKIEQKFDQDSNVKGLTHGQELPNDVGEKWLKKLTGVAAGGGDASSNSSGNTGSSNNDINVAYATDNTTPVRFEFNNETIFMEAKDKLKTGSIDNFVKAIKGLSMVDTKKKFDSKELDFDKIFEQAKAQLGDEALFEKDGKIDIDLGKKK